MGDYKVECFGSIAVKTVGARSSKRHQRSLDKASELAAEVSAYMARRAAEIVCDAAELDMKARAKR